MENSAVKCAAAFALVAMAAGAAPIRFMSFNIYGAGYGGFMAEEREERAIAVVRRQAPDLISWQEVNGGWWNSRLFKEMEEFGVVRGDEDEALVRAGAVLAERRPNWVNNEPLMYRLSRFKLLDSGLDFYHLILQKEKSLTWAVLEDRESGRRIIAFATHFWWKSNGEESDAIRELNTRHVLARIERIREKWGRLPVVGGGDLNCAKGAMALATFEQFGFADAGEVAPVRSKTPSWHGHIVRDENGRCKGRVGGQKGDAMLDHVLFSLDGFRALKHAVVTEEDAINISDHSPVVVDLELLPSASPIPAEQRMQLIAHRGWWDESVPQNSLEAIRRAYAAGFKWVETDFHHTKAGQMVCMHADGELKALTGCAKKVADLTPEDVATLDLAATSKAKDKQVHRIPLLDQVLAVVPKDGVLQAEIKGYSPQYADIFDTAVKSAGLTERNIVVSSFNYPALKDFKSRFPKYRAVWLLGLSRKSQFDAQNAIAKCKEAGIEVFCPGCGSTKNVMSRLDADRIRAAGLEFRLYGVNSPADLWQARDLGAAGFTCNFPCDASAWARSLGGVVLDGAGRGAQR